MATPVCCRFVTAVPAGAGLPHHRRRVRGFAAGESHLRLFAHQTLAVRNVSVQTLARLHGFVMVGPPPPPPPQPPQQYSWTTPCSPPTPPPRTPDLPPRRSISCRSASATSRSLNQPHSNTALSYNFLQTVTVASDDGGGWNTADRTPMQVCWAAERCFTRLISCRLAVQVCDTRAGAAHVAHEGAQQQRARNDHGVPLVVQVCACCTRCRTFTMKHL